jgi:hypothetical protein
LTANNRGRTLKGVKAPPKSRRPKASPSKASVPKPKSISPARQESEFMKRIKPFIGISPLAGKVTTDRFMKELRGDRD